MTVIRAVNAIHPQGVCYCAARASSSESHWQQIPPGFCGLCYICGAPGHVRHHPGHLACTGVWCEEHLARIAWTHELANAQREFVGPCRCPLSTEEARGFPEFVAGIACGFCDDCGEIGHTRPLPPGVASNANLPWWATTRGWCDPHWGEGRRLLERAGRPWWRFWAK